MKLKWFCTAKEIVTRLQRQVYRMGQNLCPIWPRINYQNIQGAQATNPAKNQQPTK
jgi:hypothetical protein